MLLDKICINYDKYLKYNNKIDGNHYKPKAISVSVSPTLNVWKCKCRK